MQLQRSTFLSIVLSYPPVFAVSISPTWGSFICLPSSGAVNLNITQPSIPRTPCYLSKSEVAVVFTETSYPLSFRAIKSIFELVSTDLKSHPNNDEVISSSNLWYPGDYPYNNTELFVRMTQADFTMTWGEWKNASTILAFFYTRFSTVQLDFEIKVAMGRSAKSLASGRVSLYDRGETETE